MDRYKTTIKTWNKVALMYQEKFMDLDLYDDSYDLFCELIAKKNANILEIGCGPGNITRYLLSKRPDFKIEAIDVAPNMIKLAKKNNPEVNFKVMDCRDIDQLTKKYEGIICGFCMPYLSKEDCAKLIADCSLLLNEGGILYLSAIEGNYTDSGYVTGSSGDQMFIYYYQSDFLRKHLENNNFKLLKLMTKNYKTSDSTIQNHLIKIAKK